MHHSEFLALSIIHSISSIYWSAIQCKEKIGRIYWLGCINISNPCLKSSLWHNKEENVSFVFHRQYYTNSPELPFHSFCFSFSSSNSLFIPKYYWKCTGHNSVIICTGCLKCFGKALILACLSLVLKKISEKPSIRCTASLHENYENGYSLGQSLKQVIFAYAAISARGVCIKEATFL